MVPSLHNLPQGCTFAPRCEFATDQCRAAYPPLIARPDPDRLLASPAGGRGMRRGAPTAAWRPLIEVRDLKKHFPIHKGVFSRPVGTVYAVDGVSFHIEPGETLGLVGESGCGKSTVGRTLLKLLEPTAGQIIVRGEDITAHDQERMLPYRRQMQMIYQDPYASLNPRHVGGRYRRRAADHPPRRIAPGTPGARRRAVRAGRPAAGADGPLPARVLRRPAPAHRHRPRAGAAAPS